ncbi:hypothetical protein CMUS01_02561 [Colletotrichum musicola]|uniref:Uncharacterized protein n=1 Tax=Colletotrichum musicola TaxID=2175873 RepID=A0A8H6U710_9PEZI|nr:hypothetical protein CMUS01_02561 [Colletotrichum musicola]
MPRGKRARPAQANGNSPAAGAADNNTTSRRSRRLRNDDDDGTEFLMLPQRKRRKRQTADEHTADEPADEPADESIYVTNTPSANHDGTDELPRRRSRGRPRKHRPESPKSPEPPESPERPESPESIVEDEIFVAVDSPPPEESLLDKPIWNVSKSAVAEQQPKRRPRGRSWMRRPPPPEEDIYDPPQSWPPPADEDTHNPPQSPQQPPDDSIWDPSESPPHPGDAAPDAELSEIQEGDTHLYNEPTVVGERAEAATDTGAEGDDDANGDATRTMREFVGDLGPPEPSGEPNDGPYPDDTFMFDPPAGDYAISTAFIKSHSLKHMVELMSGVGWARRGVAHSLSHGNCRSGRTRQYWEHFARVRDFWEAMPRAPLFDDQAEYLRSDEEAAAARESVAKIDEFVRVTARRAAKPFTGDEESRPPQPFVRDLHGRVIPMLVHTLCGAFSRGTESDQTPWRGRFAKPSLQIMTRVLAWVERLYEAMQKALARTPRGQQGSQRRSREKLAGYVTGLKVELEEALAEAEAAPERRRQQEERARRLLEAQERDRRQEEERKRRQRELVDSRIAERLRPYVETSQPQPEPEREPETDWAEEEDHRLLQIIKKHPDVDVRVLAWEFERGVEDVRGRVARLKQGARDYAASIGRPPPRFAMV